LPTPPPPLKPEPPIAWFPPIGIALRRCFQAGYGIGDLRADLAAGAVVGLVALPLSMALAIASGVAPQHGLYTAIVAGLLIAPLGGSRPQVSGPTAAFVALLAPVSARFGVAGLAVATLMAGLLLVAMGAMRLGRLIEFVPYPVTTGFTAGIAVVIATLQLRDFLGPSTSSTGSRRWWRPCRPRAWRTSRSACSRSPPWPPGPAWDGASPPRWRP
jgi:SulP family sulfate permease